MIRTLIRLGLLIAAALGLTSAQARQAAVAAPPPASVKTIDADPALWVVRDKDTTIYLFGSIHVLQSSPALSWLDDGVKAAFDKADQLVLEVVMPDDPATLQASVMKAALNMTGPSLSDRLNDTDRKALHDALTAQGMPDDMLDRFDPWFASLTLTQLELKKLGYDGKSGVEATLTAAAKAAGKPIIGLETVDQQFGFFDGLSDAAQVKLLNATVKELPETGAKIQDMINMWSDGQPDRLAAIINDGTADSPELAKVLLTDRNARWAKWIKARLKQPGTVFIAVGAGHLAGRDSVQAKLKALHVKAERVAY